MANVSPESEAVYYSVLANLDELPAREQKLVVMNWVKYVLTMESASQIPITSRSFNSQFSINCIDFALQVAALPDKYAAGAPPCGDPGCPGCVAKSAAEGIKH